MPAFRRSASARPKSRRSVTIAALTALAFLSLLSPVFLFGNENDSEAGSHYFGRTIKQDFVRAEVEKTLRNVDSSLPKQLVEDADRLQDLVKPEERKVNFPLLNEQKHVQNPSEKDANDPEKSDMKDPQDSEDLTEEPKEKALPKRQVNVSDPAWVKRKKARDKRQEKRLKSFASNEEVDPSVVASRNAESVARKLNASNFSSLTNFRPEEGLEVPKDQIVRLMRDQLIMARGYLALAQQQGDRKLAKELRNKFKEGMRAVGDASTDAELPRTALEVMRTTGQLLAKARDKHYDCSNMVKKLRALVQTAEEQTRALKRQTTYLSQLAAKTMPRSLTCLTLRLTLEYATLTPEKREFGSQAKLVDNSLFHYALFSDNVLAAGVVVNSTIMNAKDPSRHVFHVVTDHLNFAAMKMWFLSNPPGKATIEVQNVNDYKWLNSSYCPVLHQLESSSMKEYYFKSSAETSASDGQFLKYRNPKYLSMLNHLRFYLPEVFPALDKILFVDDDIVVQEDLSPLWKVNLGGNVNGAVETCGASFHRFDKYLNFSNPLIAQNFDPQACGWAYGMNVFDLKAWKKFDMTGIYHSWQRKNENRTLWKLGTLPPGLITFYNRTKPLDKHWHALGMGYNPNLDLQELQGAAVVHYNGNMKPWLDIAMTKFRPFWTKYVKYDHPFLQQCNFSE